MIPEVLQVLFVSDESFDLRRIHSATAIDGAIRLPASRFDELPAQLLFWPAPRSYTRETVAEIHTIGSPPILATILSAIERAGARLAEPGEFTLRAFLAGRLDLTQAEAVLGIIDAHGDAQFQSALAQLAGGLAKPLQRIRDCLLNLLAELEAGLDFSQEDIQFISREQIEGELGAARAALLQLSEQLSGRGRQDSLASVALVGWPNAGKSSLFNALSRQAQAIVSAEAGTTRDYLRAILDLDGIRCELIDTAGVEPEYSDSELQGIAQRLSHRKVGDCEIRLLCLDRTRPLNAWEREALETNHAATQLVVFTKCDLAAASDSRAANAIETSAKTGRGLTELQSRLRDTVRDLNRGDTVARLTASRCGQSLRAATDAVERAGDLNQTCAGEELVAAEVRAAAEEIGKMAGAVYTDDILDRIFSQFCIGK